jgi:hypothetical protein
MRTLLFLSICGFLAGLVGCSEQPAAKKEEAKKEEKAEPVTGQTALFRMYQVARSWAPDARILKLTSIHLTEVPAVRGAAGAWQVIFTSADKSAQRAYTYSVVESEGNLHQGVFPAMPESWSGPVDAPFLIAAVKVDTDAALKTALAESAADYDKKNPNQTISFELSRQEHIQDPTWRVIWGESAGTSGFSVLVNATTGKYEKTLH